MLAIHGPSGAVKWHWHQAASLGPWTLQGVGDSYVLTASIVSSDTYRVSQHPLVFEHVLNGRPMRWGILPDTLQVAGETLSASLSPEN